MEMWEKDPLEDFIQTFLVRLSPSKELPESIQSFQVFRDDELNIVMQVNSHADSRPTIEEKPLGLVYQLDNQIELKGYVGSGTLHRVALFNTTSKILNDNQDSATISKYKVSELNFTISTSETSYTIDHIANLPGNYTWPNASNSKESGTQEICFLGEPPITITRPLPSINSINRNCVRIEIGGHTVILASIKEKNHSSAKRPGYIFYSGNPDKTTREKIRASLSFALGMPLVYLSSCFYKETGGLIGFEASSPATMGGRAWRLVSQPFAPITSYPTNILDTNAFKQIATAFFENYDSMNLQSFIFRLWHAEISPSYMKAAYYGAMVESIQKRETHKPNSTISHTIIEKAEYRKAIKILSRFLEKQKIPKEAKESLLNKIQNGNTAPQRTLADRFYSTMGLALGSLETAAWDRRNDAAHGNEEVPGTEIESFRSTKILRVILARIVIKLLQASEYYIDYYSLDHPIRLLSQAIPNDTD